METLIMHPKTKEQSAALKAIAKAMKIPFEVEKGSPYNPEFVAKILEGINARERGEKGRKVDVDRLWD